MDLSLKPEQLRKLAVDELAVVLFLRIVFHACLCYLAGLAFLGGLMLLPDTWLRDSHKLVIAAGCAVAGLLGWAGWKLVVVRRELSERTRFVLHHTPTFELWARGTQVAAVVALLQPLLYRWFPVGWFERLGVCAWMGSCLMAGFYLLYFFLLALVRQPPPWVTVAACILAVAAAVSVPMRLLQ